MHSKTLIDWCNVQETTQPKGVLVFSRSNNPVLLRFLQNLSSVASDVFAQELVIKVVCCCQDVLSPFLSGLVATYEPRLSMPWVSNMNLVTKVRKILLHATGLNANIHCKHQRY